MTALLGRECNPLILSHGYINDKLPQIIVLLKAKGGGAFILHCVFLFACSLAELNGIFAPGFLLYAHR